MPLSTYLRNKLADHVLRNIPYTSPATVYVALYTSDPTVDNTGTEVNGGAYQRQSMAFSAPVSGDVKNSGEINFPVSTVDWGTISHFGLMDAASGGNLLIFGPFSQAKPIYSGDQYIIHANNSDITFS